MSPLEAKPSNRAIALFLLSTTVKPKLYFILGTRHSGREALVRDFISEAFTPTEPILVLLPQSLATNAASGFEHPPTTVQVQCWDFHQQPLSPKYYAFASYHAVFLLTDGTHNPIDQLELLAEWAATYKLEVSRILTVVDCKCFLANPSYFDWIAACIHFSDVVLLNRIEAFSHSALEGFIARFTSNHYPCHFYKLTPKQPINTAEVLYPEARRLSLAFEPVDDSDDQALADPYFERNYLGARVKKLPVIIEPEA